MAVTGYTPGALTGADFRWMDFVHVDDRAAARQAVAEIAERHTDQVESAFRVIGADGVEHWLRAVFRREGDGSDDLPGFFMDAYEPNGSDHPAHGTGRETVGSF